MCGEHKPAAEFYVVAYIAANGNKSRRLEPRCKPCARDRRRKSHVANRPSELAKMADRRSRNGDRYAASLRKYRDENREKVLRQRVVSEQKRRAAVHGKSDAAMIDRVLDEAKFGDLYLDAYSGELISDPQIDHIVPLSKGGDHVYENLCVTSRRNNSSKHVKPLLVWMATR